MQFMNADNTICVSICKHIKQAREHRTANGDRILDKDAIESRRGLIAPYRSLFCAVYPYRVTGKPRFGEDDEFGTHSF